MRENIWSSRPVSSPTVSRWAASGGKTPALRMGPAMPSPRLTPVATPARAPEMVLLLRVAAAMPSDCTSGTELPTRVPMARAKRAVSALRSASPSSGSLRRAPSHRSEEHTSELQSLRHLVCRLLLEKEEHTSELQSLRHLVCRLLLETVAQQTAVTLIDILSGRYAVSLSFSSICVFLFFF